MAQILIIEDNPSNRSLAVFLLQSAGHTVLSATDCGGRAADGARRTARVDPDGIQLPGMDGLQATALLKQAPLLKQSSETRAIPVIALTALAMKGDAERIRAAGCDGYIAKPVRYQELLAAVAVHLAQS